MIYLAAPYTSTDPAIERSRFEIVTAIAATYMDQGRLVFSPITYGHPFAVRGLAKGNYEFWQDFNEQMLIMCDQLFVLRLPGWDKSRGVAHEISFAENNGIPIRYIDL